LLVKPQFEVGRDRVGKKGVVRDPVHQAQAIERVLQFAQTLGWGYCGLTRSPVTGPEGNIEYLLWLKMTESAQSLDLKAIEQIAQDAIAHFRKS
jgi:23S rRNA (cytidine1920-2'-O)/16S rRNA (cytidine1409-2'-O)-methyltransferase